MCTQLLLLGHNIKGWKLLPPNSRLLSHVFCECLGKILESQICQQNLASLNFQILGFSMAFQYNTVYQNYTADYEPTVSLFNTDMKHSLVSGCVKINGAR